MHASLLSKIPPPIFAINLSEGEAIAVGICVGIAITIIYILTGPKL